MKIETLLPLNRESRDQDLQSTISVPAYSLWSRLDGGQSVEVAQWLGGTWRNPLQRSGYQQCLSVPSDLLMGRQTDHLKSSDPKASALLLAPGSARFRQVTPAWTQVDTAGHRLRRGQTRRDLGCACLRTCVCDRCADTWTRLRPVPPRGMLGPPLSV